MSKETLVRREIQARYIEENRTITLAGFYELFSTATLIRLRAGLDIDFDLACAGDPYRQPKEWLQDRLSLISRILEDREAEKPRTAHEKVWDAVEGRTAQKITKFNQ